MANIFISYSQMDCQRAEPLVDTLTAEGYEVWWDLKIGCGESFDEPIETTLEKAWGVVTVWSQHSVASEWVRAESAWAKDQRKFVSTRIDDDIKLPLKFYNVHTCGLVGWTGARHAAAFQNLLTDIAKIASPPPLPPDSLPPSGPEPLPNIPQELPEDLSKVVGPGPVPKVLEQPIRSVEWGVSFCSA